MDVESVSSSVSTDDEMEISWIKKLKVKNQTNSKNLPIPEPNPDIIFAIDSTGDSDRSNSTNTNFKNQIVEVDRIERIYKISAFPGLDEAPIGFISYNLSIEDFGLMKESSMTGIVVDEGRAFDDTYELFQLDD